MIDTPGTQPSQLRKMDIKHMPENIWKDRARRPA